MKRIKSFNEFVNETFLEKPSNADILDHNKKKMEKNGYIEVTVIEPVDGLKKGDKVLVSATEFGHMPRNGAEAVTEWHTPSNTTMRLSISIDIK